MKRLQRDDAERATLQGCDALGGRPGCGERGDSGDAGEHGGAPDGFLVEKGVLPAWGIDDELDALSLDEVDDVGAAFLDLVHALRLHACFLEDIRRAVGGDEMEAHLGKLAGERNHAMFIVVVDAEKDGAAHGKELARGDLGLGEGLAEVVGDAHDLAGRLHFGAEDGIDAGELAPRENGRFDEEVRAGVEIVAGGDLLRQEIAQLPADHEAGSDFCE